MADPRQESEQKRDPSKQAIRQPGSGSQPRGDVGQRGSEKSPLTGQPSRQGFGSEKRSGSELGSDGASKRSKNPSKLDSDDEVSEKDSEKHMDKQ